MTTEPQPEPQYTISEAAARLGCRPLTLRDWCTKRKVPHHRRFSKTGIYFTDADLEQILGGHARPAQPPGEKAALDVRAVAPTGAAGSSGGNSSADRQPTLGAAPPAWLSSHVRRGNRAPTPSAPAR